MKSKSVTAAVVMLVLAACVGVHDTKTPPSSTGNPQAEVRAAELAFAKSMADRRFEDFVSHLSRDAVFFDADSVLRGADAVAVSWKPLFAPAEAPFSWYPDHVEVLASGDLALSTGPVMVKGRMAGRFNSIWRREAPHLWRIVFDKGEKVCAPATP